MTRLLLAPLALAAGLGASQAPPAPDVAAAVARLQAKYDAMRDFRADFIQIYEGGIIRKRAFERGVVYVKKPGRMRWEYADPDRKIFVSDGLKLYSYLPADHQVIVSDAPSGEQGRAPVLFLLGQGNLEHDFVITAAPPDPNGDPSLRSLKLVPRTPQREYDILLIGIVPKTMDIARLVALDAQGGRSEFRFSDIKENTGLSDKLFTFKIPRGVDVIADDPR